ncbi:MAG: hypothetical protein ACUVTN_01780 [Thermodesulfobacteriota bacterium]
MMTKLIFIFFAGVMIDLLCTRYTRSVAEKKLWNATLLSGLITLTNFVLLSVILSGSVEEGFLNILAYAGGNTVGTYIALKKI